MQFICSLLMKRTWVEYNNENPFIPVPLFMLCDAVAINKDVHSPEQHPGLLGPCVAPHESGGH